MKKNRRPLLLLLVIFVAPLALAFWLYYGSRWRPALHTNHGALIDPAVTLPALPLAAVSAQRPGRQVDAAGRRGRRDRGAMTAAAERSSTRARPGCPWASSRPRMQRVLLAGEGCCDHGYLRDEHPGLVVAPLCRTVPWGASSAAIPDTARAHDLYRRSLGQSDDALRCAAGPEGSARRPQKTPRALAYRLEPMSRAALIRPLAIAALSCCACVVVVLGAYVRLSAAGLSCPDWPGCYGQFLPPARPPADSGIEVGKAWKEMVHRYAAATLGLLSCVIAALAIQYRRQRGSSRRLRLGPRGARHHAGNIRHADGHAAARARHRHDAFVVGSDHAFDAVVAGADDRPAGRRTRGAAARLPGLEPPAHAPACLARAGVLVVQLALGGWTSSHYAATGLPGFPDLPGPVVAGAARRGRDPLRAPAGRARHHACCWCWPPPACCDRGAMRSRAGPPWRCWRPWRCSC